MRVSQSERDYLSAEAGALAEQVRGEAAQAYRRIADAAELGEVPDELDALVGDVAALALETGRAESLHGPAGVRSLLAVWKQTPQGIRAAAEAASVSEALSGLAGAGLRGVRVIPAGPGAYTVTVSAGEVEMRLALDRDGVRLRSVAVGGGDGGGE